MGVDTSSPVRLQETDKDETRRTRSEPRPSIPGLMEGKTTYQVNIICNEPRHDKTFLREFPTRPDTNRPAQPQKLARVLQFLL